MGWIADILSAIGGNRKLIIDGFKDLYEVHKRESAERKAENAELLRRLELLEGNERGCLQRLSETTAELRDVKEELIFIKKMIKHE